MILVFSTILIRTRFLLADLDLDQIIYGYLFPVFPRGLYPDCIRISSRICNPDLRRPPVLGLLGGPWDLSIPNNFGDIKCTFGVC